MDTTEDGLDVQGSAEGHLEARPALVLLWCADDPSRVGEVALPAALSADLWVLGRGDRPPPRGTRLGLVRQRPGLNAPRGPLEAQTVSREQLGLRWDGRRLVGEKLGSAAMTRNGLPYEGGLLEPGDLLTVGRSWLWRVEARPTTLPALRVGVPSFPFGKPDAWGLVGESPAIWALRERVATVAPLAMHVFLQGPSGAGKELVARALHTASARSQRPFISRNAATLPQGLVDAELFGNVRGYPNPTMNERPGLIGAADGGTLFLDELGELPHEVQAHLLRVLDDGGEYQRLGEAQTRRSDFRLVGATNRPASALKHDLLQRFRLRVEVPGLDERPSDIPLLLLHLLELLRERSPSLYQRGLVSSDRGAEPVSASRAVANLEPAVSASRAVANLEPAVSASRAVANLEPAVSASRAVANLEPAVSASRAVANLDLAFVASLVARREWVGHVRELDAELWQAFLDTSAGPIGGGRAEVQPGAGMATPGADLERPREAEEGRTSNEDPGSEAIEAALAQSGGNISAAARELGLSSRYALYRLMQRHGLVSRRGP